MNITRKTICLLTRILQLDYFQWINKFSLYEYRFNEITMFNIRLTTIDNFVRPVHYNSKLADRLYSLS